MKLYITSFVYYTPASAGKDKYIIFTNKGEKEVSPSRWFKVRDIVRRSKRHYFGEVIEGDVCYYMLNSKGKPL